MARDHRKLRVFHDAHGLVLANLPAHKEFSERRVVWIRLQMRKAAVSVPSNVAEGHASGPGGRYRHHVRIAIGSLAELDTQIELAVRLRFIEKDTLAAVTQQLTRTRQLLHGLARSIRRSQNA